jgi:hypothetical protein
MIPEENRVCPSCGSEMPQQLSAKDGRTILAAVAIVIAAALIIAFAAPALSDWARPPSQEYLVSASDLGANWYSTEPSRPTNAWENINNSADQATTYLHYHSDSRSSKGMAYLALFETSAQAGSTFDDEVAKFVASLDGNCTLTGIACGDRSALVTHGTDGPQTFFLLKGDAVAEICLNSMSGPQLTAGEWQEIGFIQADKIPL